MHARRHCEARAEDVPEVTPVFFHVVNRSAKRLHLLQRPRDYRAFVGILEEGLRRHPVRLVAYCLLSDHWHLVLGPTDPRTVATLVRWVAATHAAAWRQHHNAENATAYRWPARVRALASTADIVRTSRVVERRALRLGLTRRAQDWPWGSLSERLRPETTLPLVSTPFLSSNAWIDYVNTSLGEGNHLAQRPRTFTQGTQTSQHRIRVRRTAHENHADAHVERPKHLDIVHSAPALQPLEERRHGPAVAIE